MLFQQLQPLKEIFRQRCRAASSVLYRDPTEAERTRLPDWIAQTSDEIAPDLLETSEIDLVDFQTRSDVPDMTVGQAAELTAPVHRQRDGAEGCQEQIAAVLAAGEAPVGALPDAVCRVHTLWFTEYVFEHHLHMTVDAVWITIFQIWST